MANEWLDKMLGNKIDKEAMDAVGKDAKDTFDRKVVAHPWVNDVLSLDADAIDKEYNAKLAEEARLLGKTAALDDVIADGVTPEETVNRDYKRDVTSLSDYALAEMLAEARGHKAQNTNEMYYELKETAKKEVASSREKAEKALLELIPDNAQLDWQKAFKEYTKDATPAEAKEKDLFKSDVPEKAHDFDKPSEDKFKMPKDADKALPGNGREVDERKEVTQEAGVLKADIVEGINKDASQKIASQESCPDCEAVSSGHGGRKHYCDKHQNKEAHCGECPGDPGMEQKGAPEEIEKDAAQNGAVISAFVSGQGGASSANLHVVKGSKGMVLVNYETPIAYRSADGELFMNSDKYSPTTSKIQSAIKAAANGQIKEVSAAELEAVMEGKPGIVPNAPVVAPVAEKTADGPSASDNCPVCGQAGKDLGNGQKDNMSCEACGLTYACASLTPKASEGLEVEPRDPNYEETTASDIAETFINGNISDAREWVGGDLDKFMAVMDVLGYGSPEGQSFQRIMRKAALKEIKNAATKSEVIKKIAELKKVSEVNSPWQVVIDPETGAECIARISTENKTVKESEEDVKDELIK